MDFVGWLLSALPHTFLKCCTWWLVGCGVLESSFSVEEFIYAQAKPIMNITSVNYTSYASHTVSEMTRGGNNCAACE